jgi:DNA-3-methyladenine glycosylase I
MAHVVAGPDRKLRCFWAGSAPDYVRYHDEEWGLPTDDDVRLVEKVCLEGFQAGLSWLTILRKRDAFRRAFAGFDLEKVARFGARDVRRLLADAGIVRHRGKIESTINNARRACELRDERGSLAAYFWGFEPAPAARPRRLTWATLRRMTTTPESVALSKDLRRRGWTFVGPTTSYAFMQAVGIVNDHLDGCSFRARAERARRAFGRDRPAGAATAGAPADRTAVHGSAGAPSRRVTSPARGTTREGTSAPG